jgi:hypothetical protein
MCFCRKYAWMMRDASSKDERVAWLLLLFKAVDTAFFERRAVNRMGEMRRQPGQCERREKIEKRKENRLSANC